MNRVEEYERLMQELDAPVPGLEKTLERAITRNARRKRLLRPVTGLAAAFATFVLLVNFCTPVAYACSKVPILKELAEAVTFSRSLTDAVDNRYVQPLHLEQTDNGITASVEYLIVDQKQVNVFYRLNSDIYECMSADPTVLFADGSHPASCTYSNNEWDVPAGKLQSTTIDFIDSDVPSSLRFQLNIQNYGTWQEEEAAEPAPEQISADDALLEEAGEGTPDYVAHFDFLLEFDPDFTASGKVINIDQTVELEGQSITFTTMEIYPTHLRVNVADTPENTAWLKRLDFYIETDWGMKFDPITNGITATGSVDSPMMSSYRADSSYFYEAKHLKLVITGAEWLDKDMERIYLDLKTGQADRLPEGVTLDSIRKKENGWILSFRAPRREPGHSHQLMSHTYYDADGNEYFINSWQTGTFDDSEDGTFCETIPLKDYPYDEVWLCPQYSHEWVSENPIVVVAQ